MERVLPLVYAICVADTAKTLSCVRVTGAGFSASAAGANKNAAQINKHSATAITIRPQIFRPIVIGRL